MKFTLSTRKGHVLSRDLLPNEGVAELRAQGISVSEADEKAFGDLPPGKVCRNPKDMGDQWYVAREFFENNYYSGTEMDFSRALGSLKMGLKVARKGWNGKGMWLAYTPGSTIPADQVKGDHALTLLAMELPEPLLAMELPELAAYKIHDHIDLRTADGTLLCDWVPNGLDLLADDWVVIA